MSKSELEASMALQIRAAGLPEPVTELRFWSGHKHRFDFCWPTLMLALEVDGGQWAPHGGRHNTDGDRRKLNAAVMLGWKVLRVSGEMVKSGEALDLVRRALEGK